MPKFPNWCCQECSAPIGTFGNWLRRIGVVLHDCNEDRQELLWKQRRESQILAKKQAAEWRALYWRSAR